MSWATCYSSSNNIHFDFPPLMSDSRIYTKYDRMITVDKKIMKNNEIRTNNDYRKYLVENAVDIMNNNHVSKCNNVGSHNFENNFDRRFKHYNKYLFKSVADTTQPYGYESSDLKNAYLSRERLQSKMVAPLMSQQGYLLQGL